MPRYFAALAGFFLIAALLCHCTTVPLYSFVVYSDTQPKARARLFRPPIFELDEIAERGIGTPSALKVAIYSFYLGTTPDCAAPTPLIDYGSNPLTKEFYAKPTLFSGNPAATAYHCVVLKVSDTLSFRPDSAAVGSSTACESTDIEYFYDGYRSGQSDADTWKALSGATVSATGAVTAASSDVVTLFASTDPQAAIDRRELASNQVLTLENPLVVPGEITLFANYLNAIVQASGVCTLSGGLTFGLN